MQIKTYIICLFLLCCLGVQAQRKKFSKQPASIEKRLEEARTLKASNPTKAIEILESVFGQAKRGKNTEQESEAYFLLGEIYEQIGQKELALQRYESAYQVSKDSKDFGLVTIHLLALGDIHKELNHLDKAKTYFQKCVDYGTSDVTAVRCREGLADVAIASQDFNEGMRQNDYIRVRYPSDSLLQSKNMARNSIIFSNQNQPEKAKESYYNSIQNIPQQQISKEEFKPIQSAKNILLEEGNSTIEERIELNLTTIDNVPMNALPEEVVVEQNLELAELYVEQNNLEEAEKQLAAAYKVIKPGTSAEKKAEVYKKAAEVKEKKGDYKAAEAAYAQYVEEKDKIIETKTAELTQLIAILKGQGKIDLLAKDVELEEKDAVLLKNQLFAQKIIISLLSLLLAMALGAFYFIFKNVKAKRQANQLLLLKSLRTQMNPHFIFNALNSINNFISKNDERSANKFLTDFSRLMRLVLDHSQKDFITLDEELNLIDLYLKLEHLRFRDKFDFEFYKDPALQAVDLQIPPMLIQPFIENAIWHGLRYKSDKGKLLVHIKKENETILVAIKDDGIGREKSKALKTDNQKNYKSEGLKNVNKRLALINKIYDKNYQLHIADLTPEQEDVGTLVHLKIPT